MALNSGSASRVLPAFKSSSACASRGSPWTAPSAAAVTAAPHPDQAGDRLWHREALAVALPARVGRDRLLGLVGHLAAGIDLATQRGREAFALRIARLAVDDHRNDALAAAEHLEPPHLLV